LALGRRSYRTLDRKFGANDGDTCSCPRRYACNCDCWFLVGGEFADGRPECSLSLVLLDMAFLVLTTAAFARAEFLGTFLRNMRVGIAFFTRSGDGVWSYIWSKDVTAPMRSNRSVDTDVLSAGFADLLSAGQLRR
jgi:hypothetical protein